MWLVFLTFLVTTALYGVLLWLACRRVSRHLQGNADAVKAVADHVLIPLLSRRPDDPGEPPPAAIPSGHESSSTRPGEAGAPLRRGQETGGGNAQDANSGLSETSRPAGDPKSGHGIGRGRRPL